MFFGVFVDFLRRAPDRQSCDGAAMRHISIQCEHTHWLEWNPIIPSGVNWGSIYLSFPSTPSRGFTLWWKKPELIIIIVRELLSSHQTCCTIVKDELQSRFSKGKPKRLSCPLVAGCSKTALDLNLAVWQMVPPSFFNETRRLLWLWWSNNRGF